MLEWLGVGVTGCWSGWVLEWLCVVLAWCCANWVLWWLGIRAVGCWSGWVLVRVVGVCAPVMHRHHHTRVCPL